MLNSSVTLYPTTSDLFNSTTNYHDSTPELSSSNYSTSLTQQSTMTTIENATLFSPSSIFQNHMISNTTSKVVELHQTTTTFLQNALNSTFSTVFQELSSTVFDTSSTSFNTISTATGINPSTVLAINPSTVFDNFSKIDNNSNFTTTPIISPTSASTLLTPSSVTSNLNETLSSTFTAIIETTLSTLSTTTTPHHNSTFLVTTNGSGLQQPVAEPLTPIDLFTATMLVLLFFIGTIGNALTIWIFMIKKKRKRKRFELLLSVLAITDLFSSILIPLLFLYGTLTKYKRWDMGYLGCKLISSLFPVSVSLSQGILILISYDRYRSMSNPFGNPIRGTTIGAWVAISLAVSCALVSPYYYALELVSSPMYGINTCAPSPYKFDHIYIYSCGNILRDVIATVALVVLGVLTNRSLKSKQGNLFSNLSAFNKRQRNANKARKMLIVVACVFSFCVVPLDLFQVLVYTLVKLRVNIDASTYDIILKANTLLIILQVANSSTNFIIYSKMNRNFMPQLFACIQRGKHYTSSFRATFRSTRSDSLDSLTNTAAVILTVLPVTPDSVFLTPGGIDTLDEEQHFHFPEPNNNF